MYASSKIGVANNSSFTGGWSKLQEQTVNAGILFDWMVTPEFQIGLNVEALYIVQGREKDGEDGEPVTERKYKNNVNWMFELPLTWQLNPA